MGPVAIEIYGPLLYGYRTHENACKNTAGIDVWPILDFFFYAKKCALFSPKLRRSHPENLGAVPKKVYRRYTIFGPSTQFRAYLHPCFIDVEIISSLYYNLKHFPHDLNQPVCISATLVKDRLQQVAG